MDDRLPFLTEPMQNHQEPDYKKAQGERINWEDAQEANDLGLQEENAARPDLPPIPPPPPLIISSGRGMSGPYVHPPPMSYYPDASSHTYGGPEYYNSTCPYFPVNISMREFALIAPPASHLQKFYDNHGGYYEYHHYRSQQGDNDRNRQRNNRRQRHRSGSSGSYENRRSADDR